MFITDDKTNKHYDHKVVRDQFAMDYHGAPPDTLYCLECHESFRAEILEAHDKDGRDVTAEMNVPAYRR